MAEIPRRLRRAVAPLVADVRQQRNIEAYTAFLVGLAVAALSLADAVALHYQLAALLLGVNFLIFASRRAGTGDGPALDRVLRGREAFQPFGSLLPGVEDLRIYGPTAAHVLLNNADIRKLVLARGGSVRCVILAQDAAAVAGAALQLDDSVDLASTLAHSAEIVRRLGREEPNFEFRRLAVNPGFSLLIVNAHRSDGYAIVELHGFQDENIADRMHLRISRRESPRWLDYWIERYDALWKAARPELRDEES
ncbi:MULTISPECIES: hypothetical protein [unclassified Streptomyces]|uniref:hypothetical protein n=1 Tax=unclassified Streptomyces TaxID=2593676 RepID=UPI001F04EC2F|nr:MULTISPECIES: hypothetical protein [unclassified Streptomyces]MCH0564892.1 hypothetical protein [Streptomyces sp. MUM 2J]MCH0571077.1 hypothetical protein [Streptomyces sp. MUM 136J]